MKFYRILILYMSIILLSYCIEKESAIGEKKENASKEKYSQLNITKISSILKEPDKFINREVIVKGKVEPGLAFEFIDEQPYKLIDDSGAIWIVTSRNVPEKGKIVVVKGKVLSPYQIKGRNYKIVILESERLK